MKIRRFKTTTALLIPLLLGTIISASLFIVQLTSNINAEIENATLPILTIGMDEDAVLGYLGVESGEFREQYHVPLTSEIFQRISDLTYVQQAEFDQIQRFFSHELQNLLPMAFNPHAPEITEPLANSFEVYGVQSPEFLFLQQGVVELSEGRSFSQEEIENSDGAPVAIISRQFATLNNLSLNGTFTLDNSLYIFDWATEMELGFFSLFREDNLVATQPKTFEIIGIFDYLTPDSADRGRMQIDESTMKMEMNGLIFVPHPVIEQAREFLQSYSPTERSLRDDTSLFLLNNFSYMTSFLEAAEEILPPFYNLFNRLHFQDRFEFLENHRQLWQMESLAALVLISTSILAFIVLIFTRKDGLIASLVGFSIALFLGYQAANFYLSSQGIFSAPSINESAFLWVNFIDFFFAQELLWDELYLNHSGWNLQFLGMYTLIAAGILLASQIAGRLIPFKKTKAKGLEHGNLKKKFN
ncbi:MAG: hypothetical protein FWF59_12480 [Turicibacter sp.]|nr:hypothetical protein [Turicibacter sp.]